MKFIYFLLCLALFLRNFQEIHVLGNFLFGEVLLLDLEASIRGTFGWEGGFNALEFLVDFRQLGVYQFDEFEFF